MQISLAGDGERASLVGLPVALTWSRAMIVAV
jgi:hypothetical protein